MAITASELRRNVYRLLDEVLASGVPIEVDRKGRRVQIIAVPEPSRLAALRPHPGFIVGDPEDLVHMDWSSEWDPGPALE